MEALQLMAQFCNCSTLSESARAQASALKTGFESGWLDAMACIRRKCEMVMSSSQLALGQASEIVKRREAHGRQLLEENGDSDLVSYASGAYRTCTCELVTSRCIVLIHCGVCVRAAGSTRCRCLGVNCCCSK